MFRDPETLEPVEYYCKLPADCEERRSICSRSDACYGRILYRNDQMLKNRGVKISVLCVLLQHRKE